MSARQSILVVDDNPSNLRLLSGILSDQNYIVRPVTDGALAVSAAQAEPPDLILLDIMMPKMSGYQVCERLKADERTRDIPIIFISAKHEIVDKVKAFSLGAVDYVTKPFQEEEVLARVETHLTLRNLRKQLEKQNRVLSETLEHLKATQHQLVIREKMAALGHLIAGIAHEINTPLGAIQASVDNISNATTASITQLPQLFKLLSPERQNDFLSLVQTTLEKKENLSSREVRKIKRKLTSELDALGIAKAKILANMLTNMGIDRDIDQFLPLLREENNVLIVQSAYNLFMQRSNSENIKMAVERASKVVFALKNYAHYDESAQKLKVDITEGLDVVLTLYHNQLKRGIDVVTDYEDIPLVACYPDELNQVWTNLIQNAIQAMRAEGTLEIKVARQDQDIMVTITDSGPGIPSGIMSRIFEPFFTTKSAGEGSGLGLDIVRRIIARHQGKIEVESQPGKTSFTILLPVET